ncbi:MAG: Glu/Leu/Phe/Val dehydrogenase dimerization domain-containing protein [Myxococcota bacterium]
MSSALLGLSLPAFAERLREEGIRRFYVATRPGGEVIASHPALATLADHVAADPIDYDGHEGFFAELCPRTGVLFGACIHRTRRGQAAGGVRFWGYPDVAAFLRDGLRLALGMTLKNALAGLWWGGGKGLMARGMNPREDNPEVRTQIYEGYGRFISSLRGSYVTAEDVGTSVQDMAAVFRTTRFTTCIPESFGGSGNPSVPTAHGVVCGMEAALAHLERGDLRGKVVAVQGLGHVGEPLVARLHALGVARVIGSDVDPSLASLAARYPRLEVRIVPRGDTSIASAPADVFAPCAVGGVLDAQVIATLGATIVCGAANNQLRDPIADAQRLHARGVTYVPDFLVNRMGIVQCADEASGFVPDDPRFEAHLGRTDEGAIYPLTRRVLDEAKARDRPAAEIAHRMAVARSMQPHPIWGGHRAQRIIDGLIAEGWAHREPESSSST